MRAQQGEGHRPGHGLEQAAFHALQGEDGQIGGDDDGDGVEDRPLHLVRGRADPVCHGVWPACARGPDGGRCSPPSRPRRRRPCRSPGRPGRAGSRGYGCRSRQIDAKSREKGMVSATMRAPRTLPRKRKSMIDTRMMSFREVVQDGVRGVVDAGRCGRGRARSSRPGAGCARSALRLFRGCPRGSHRSRPLCAEDDALDHVVVVDDFAVGAMDGPADLAQADLRPLRHRGDVLDAHGRAVLAP